MTKRNQEVLECLNDYKTLNKPGYAVLIKGLWGCGKTFFIKEWINSLRVKKEEDNEYYILDPIYVSLYGLSSTKQIDDEIKRSLSPFLHSRAMKAAGKVLKLAISAAVRYDIDLDNDGDNDMRMTCTIDPKALLGSNDPHIKGNRLLVFDDMERSKMKIEEVLGYINYYVEHIGCNVVIVGDDSKLKDLDNYKSIKEKTIGREFLIDPDVNIAVDAFVSEKSIKERQYLSENRNVIKACFIASETNNLRILKQSIDDFCLMIGRLNDDVLNNPNFEIIKQRLLANFVAVYAEDKGQDVSMENYSEVFVEEVSEQMAIDLTGNGEPTSREMTKKHNKYEKAGLTNKYYALVPYYADFVLAYLSMGKVNHNFVVSELQKLNKMPWDILEDYFSLDNETLSKNIDLNAGYLESGTFDSVDQMLRSAKIMLSIIRRGMAPEYSAEKVNTWCAKLMREKYYGGCRTQNELHEMRNHVITCMEYYAMGNNLKEIDDFMKALNAVYTEIEATLKNDISFLLESLRDDNVDQLYVTYGGGMPDHSTSYSMSAIFANVDPGKFVGSYVKLSNESKKKVWTLIMSHYSEALNIQNSEDMVYHYIDDLKTLPDIIALLAQEADNYQLADKLNITMLKENLEKNVEKIKNANAKRKNLLSQ